MKIANIAIFGNLYCMYPTTISDLSKNLPPWGDGLLAAAYERARAEIMDEALDFSRYVDDPIGFGEQLLGDKYTDDMKEVMQSILKYRVTVAKSSNSVGKTHGAARIALWFYKVFPDAKVYCTAPPPFETNLKDILWGEIMSAVNRSPHLFENDSMTDNPLKISRQEKDQNGRIIATPFIEGLSIPTTGTSENKQSRFSGKHSPHLLFIVDEGDAVPDEVYKGIDMCMSGGLARLLVMFNPKAQQGPVYKMEAEQRAHVIQLSAFRHPNVITGEDRIPGAISREVVVQRINLWTRPAMEGERTDATNSFDVPDFLVNTTATSPQGLLYPPLPAGKRIIMDGIFSYNILGQYPAQSEWQLISQEWIATARQRWDEYVRVHGEIPPSIPPRMGLDVAEGGPDLNAPIFRYGDFVARIPRIWQGVDPQVTIDFAIDLCDQYRPDNVYVDGTGAGSGVAPGMARQRPGLRAFSIMVGNTPTPAYKTEQGEFYQLRDQLWWSCREWLRTQPAMLPPEPMLIEELMIPQYSMPQSKRGKIYVTDKDTMRARLGRSPNFADALVLTFTPIEKARVMRLSDGQEVT